MVMAASEFSTPIDDRYFEDYAIGAHFAFGPVSVEEEDIVSFATRFDPQAMHVNPARAREGRYGGLIASGWHTVSLMMRLFVENYLSAVASHASPGVDEVRWYQPVRPKDTLLVRVSVLDARTSRTKPDRGIVISLVEALNQNDIVVCSFKAVNLIDNRKS